MKLTFNLFALWKQIFLIAETPSTPWKTWWKQIKWKENNHPNEELLDISQDFFEDHILIHRLILISLGYWNWIDCLAMAKNLTFSGGKYCWNGLKLSWNNPSPLAHHFHEVSLPRSSGAMCYHAKTYLGQRLLGTVRGWKKHDRVTIWQAKKMHHRQLAILGLILSILMMTAIWSAKPWTAFSHYSWGDRNSQDLVHLLSLLLRRSNGSDRGYRPQQV